MATESELPFWFLVFEKATIPIVVAGIGISVAFWSNIQSWHRGRSFEKLILRELEEVGPKPLEDGKEWYEHFTKGEFIHRKIINEPTQNRDFILSIDPSLVYLVSQLWSAFDHKDAVQWLYYLREISAYPKIPLEFKIKHRAKRTDFEKVYKEYILGINQRTYNDHDLEDRYNKMVLEEKKGEKIINYKFDRKGEIYQACKRWDKIINPKKRY